MTEEQLVLVRRQLKDWRVAKYRLSDLTDVHWDRPSAGAKGPAAGSLLSAQVSCDAIVEGELSHTGSYGPCPHSIKVHIAKKENDPRVFARLAQLAGPQPTGSSRQ